MAPLNMLATIAALLVLPCAAYFDPDKETSCPFSHPEYIVQEKDMSETDAEALSSCNAVLSNVEQDIIDMMVVKGVSQSNATADICFARACWWAEYVTMEAMVGIPPGELMHNGFPHLSYFNLSALEGTNVSGLCFPPVLSAGGNGYICSVPRPSNNRAMAEADETRRRMPDASATTWILDVDYYPSVNNFKKPSTESDLKLFYLGALAILIALILIAVVSGGKSSGGAAQL